jgi:hypothetical protein
LAIIGRLYSSACLEDIGDWPSPKDKREHLIKLLSVKGPNHGQRGRSHNRARANARAAEASESNSDDVVGLCSNCKPRVSATYSASAKATAFFKSSR